MAARRRILQVLQRRGDLYVPQERVCPAALEQQAAAAFREERAECYSQLRTAASCSSRGAAVGA